MVQAPCSSWRLGSGLYPEFIYTGLITKDPIGVPDQGSATAWSTTTFNPGHRSENSDPQIRRLDKWLTCLNPINFMEEGRCGSKDSDVTNYAQKPFICGPQVLTVLQSIIFLLFLLLLQSNSQSPFGYVEKTWVQSHTDRCKRYGIGDIRRVVTCVPFGLTHENFYICMLYRGFEESMVGGLTSNQKGVDRAL